MLQFLAITLDILEYLNCVPLTTPILYPVEFEYDVAVCPDAVIWIFILLNTTFLTSEYVDVLPPSAANTPAERTLLFVHI